VIARSLFDRAGTVAGFKSESVAGFRRNPQPIPARCAENEIERDPLTRKLAAGAPQSQRGRSLLVAHGIAAGRAAIFRGVA
jgi:hypothetical protein